MPRTPLIAGNWKMNKTAAEARELARAVVAGTRDAPGVEVLLCPPFTALAAVAEELAGSAVKLGAQNLFYEEEGAYTGEVSAKMLAASGVAYVIVGHSERRQIFGEDDDVVNKKVGAALTRGLNVIVCVGETLAVREGGDWEGLIRGQLAAALAGLEPPALASVTAAYEPIWAIGTGKTATPAQAASAHRALREEVAARFGAAAAAEMRILYGGSVKAENAPELMAQEDIDGALVGGASLAAATFVPIVRFGA